MLTGKYVKLETIVERVYRDTGFNVDIDWTDIAEWIGSVIDLIDTPMAYNSRITDGNDHEYIEIANGRGELPCDLYEIVQTRTCEGQPMQYSTDSFHFKMHAEGCSDLSCNSNLTYKLKDGHIYPNFKSGKIEMAYLAFPTDERGYPLVPDNETFKQAATAYVAERIGYRLYLQSKIDINRYEKLNQERLWYIGKAQTKAHIPNRDRIETIANQFRKIIDLKQHHADGYKGLGVKQIIRNHNR